MPSPLGLRNKSSSLREVFALVLIKRALRRVLAIATITLLRRAKSEIEVVILIRVSYMTILTHTGSRYKQTYFESPKVFLQKNKMRV
jgi:hypothetical protein